jgi:hypothetical protein
MQPVFASLPTVAVSAIFCVWNAYRHHLFQRSRVLRERVAYMLWTMAMGPEQSAN